MKLALKKADDADLNIIVVEPKTVDFTHFYKDLKSKKAILVVNKSDLQNDQTNDKIKKYDPIYISIKEEKNLDQLINLIKEHLKNKFIFTGETYITRERHRNNLKIWLDNLMILKKKTLEDFDAAEDED